MNNKHKHAGHIITIEGHSFKSNESGMWNLVTNGAIVIHTQRLKSDPGGNLLS